MHKIHHGMSLHRWQPPIPGHQVPAPTQITPSKLQSKEHQTTLTSIEIRISVTLYQLKSVANALIYRAKNVCSTPDILA